MQIKCYKNSDSLLLCQKLIIFFPTAPKIPNDSRSIKKPLKVAAQSEVLVYSVHNVLGLSSRFKPCVLLKRRILVSNMGAEFRGGAEKFLFPLAANLASFMCCWYGVKLPSRCNFSVHSSKFSKS